MAKNRCTNNEETDCTACVNYIFIGLDGTSKFDLLRSQWVISR